MTSREIRHLSRDVQILYNKFNDRCRRDLWLLKHGVSLILTCTYRSNEDQEKLHAADEERHKGGKSKHNVVLANGEPAAEAFDVLPLRYGKPVGYGSEDDAIWEKIREHGEAVGLKWNSSEPEHLEAA